MAGNSTISISFKVDDDGKGFKQLSTDADGLKKVLSSTVGEAKQLNAEVINFASLATGVEKVAQSLEQLRAGMQELADAYAIQEEAEVRLAVVMRQRMAASDEEIKSIKALASAQQELGVIGDEVQLIGAQQMSTYLSEVDSLRVLIPAMNNLLAKRKGLNVTGEEAITVGTMMGKVMRGEATALNEAGIALTDAEAEVIKFGKESERAAMLAEIISKNIGEMNAALAQTDSGKQKQLDNTLGDMKETLGNMVNGALPFVTIASSALSATVNVGLLAMGIQKLLPYITAVNVQGKGAAAATLLMGIRAKHSAAVMRVFSMAMRDGAFKATALKLALRGLLMATGVGIAITAVTMAINAFSDSAEEAAEKENELAKESREFKKSIRDIGKITADEAQQEIVALDELYRIAKNEAKSKAERAAAISKLQDKYPAYFGNLDKELSDVKDLTTQYNSLREAILKSAKARAARKKIEENTGQLIEVEQKLSKAQQQVDALTAKANAAKAANTNARAAARTEQANQNFLTTGLMAAEPIAAATTPAQQQVGETNAQYVKLNKQLAQASKTLSELKAKQAELNAANQELVDIVESTPEVKTKTPKTDPKKEPKWKEDAATLKEITDNIAILNKQLQSATVEEAAGINQQIEAWNKKAQAIRDAGKASKDTELLWKEDAATLKEIGDNISILNKQLQTATVEEAALINQQIAAWTKKRDAIQNAGKAATDTALVWTENATALKDITENVQILQNKLETATIEEAALINQQIDAWNKKADAIRNAGKEAEKTGKSVGDNLVAGWGAIKCMTSSVETMVDAIKNGGNAWQIICTSLDTVVGLYQGVKSIIEVVQAFAAISAAHAAAKAVETTTETTAASARAASAATTVAASATTVAANKAESASFRELAASEYMAAHAGIPFAGYAIGAGFTASMLATVAAAGIPMLAEGGIASGPTLAMVGEYAGASGNPEVIAPLDKLRRMIEPAGFGGGEVELKIKGRSLVGLLTKETKHRNRG